MKPLNEMNNGEKIKLLVGLFPDQMLNVIMFMDMEVRRFLTDEQHIRSRWTGALITDNLWYDLVRNIEQIMKNYGRKLEKKIMLFADQLFEGYNALFTVYCLMEFAGTDNCHYQLKQAIQLLFGEEKIIQITFKQ